MTRVASWRGKLGRIVLPTTLLLCLATGARAETPAGTAIVNRADAHYAIGDDVAQVSSNAVTLVVAERLDVGVRGDGAPTTIVRAPTPVVATVVNMGTGHEAFDLSLGVSSGLKVEMLAIDRDGDGRYDPAIDQRLSGSTPVLAPGESLPLVALVVPDADPVDGTLTITARAETGSGETDRTLPGMGDGGSDAVIGRTGAVASAALPLVAAAATSPTLVKRQSMLAPDGSARATSGAIVTYTLVATLPKGSARNPVVDDPVPDGSSYVAGSMTLDGAPLSDAADTDAGRCDGRLVSVALGDPASADAVRTVTFQVRLP